MTWRAPCPRASQTASEISAAPDAAAPGGLVDDDVFDHRVQPGRDPVDDEGERADDRARRREASRATRSELPGEVAILSSAARSGAAAVEDSCGTRRAMTSTSSSVDLRDALDEEVVGVHPASVPSGSRSPEARRLSREARRAVPPPDGPARPVEEHVDRLAPDRGEGVRAPDSRHRRAARAASPRRTIRRPRTRAGAPSSAPPTVRRWKTSE